MGRAQNHWGHLGRHSGSGKFKLKHEGQGEGSRSIMRRRTILAEGVTCAMAQEQDSRGGWEAAGAYQGPSAAGSSKDISLVP